MIPCNAAEGINPISPPWTVMNCPLFVQRTNQTRAGALQGLLSFSMLMKKSSCLSLQKKKKKSLLRGKKNKKGGSLKARTTPEKRGEKHKELKASLSRTLARNSPWKSFPSITEC